MFKKSSELSTSIDQDFRPDLIDQFGLSGEITALAYDPVQSLFAAGTDTGLVHVMGSGSIRAVLDSNPKRKGASAPIVFLRFVESVFLVTIDDRSLIVVWALDTRQEWARYQSPLSIMSVWTDPAMDWLLMGHHNGEVSVFDIERGKVGQLRIPNLEKIVNPKFSTGTALSLSLHPRDPSMLLICYREVAVVWNLVKKEIMYDMHHEFPMTAAVWHPSGSHVATAHVNGFVVFWDGLKGVKLGARSAFPKSSADLDNFDKDVMPEGLAWCCKEDPTDTYLVAWGGSTMSMVEFGVTLPVAVTSYEAMGNFFKSEDLNTAELRLTTPIKFVQVLPKAGNPHFQGCYDPSHLVIGASSQLMVVQLPALRIAPFDSAALPPALCWRSSPVSYLTTVGIPRNQWIGMMAAALPNTKVTGGSSASQQIRKLQLSTVMCLGCANGTVKLFDGTHIDSHDYRIVMTSIANLDPNLPHEKVTKVSVGAEAGEMAVSGDSGNVYLMTFGKNNRLQHPGAPAPSPEIENIEHLVTPELHQGFIPQWLIRSNVPVTALTNSNVGFVAIAYENGRLVVIDKRGPAIILDTEIKGSATVIDFGIMALGSDPYSSIVMSVGTTRGDILVYRVVPRHEGGYQVPSKSKEVTVLSVAKEPITHLAHVDAKEGRSAQAIPDVMARLASGIQVQGAILGTTADSAKFFAMTGTKSGKKVGSKSFDTPLVGVSYAYLRWGTSSALVTVNVKGKIGIYGLPGLGTMCTYPSPIGPTGQNATVSEMGDAFLPYDDLAHAGQIIRVFGTDQFPKEDEVYQLRRRVPARPTISTVHWMGGRQFVKVEELDKIMAGSRRGKPRRPKHQLVDDAPVEEPDKKQGAAGVKSWFGGKSVPQYSHPHPTHRAPQKTWGQTFNDYYESAEGTVNEALDGAMESMIAQKKETSNSVVKGMIGRKLGF